VINSDLSTGQSYSNIYIIAVAEKLERFTALFIGLSGGTPQLISHNVLRQ
jgi:hypothetical protein